MQNVAAISHDCFVSVDEPLFTLVKKPCEIAFRFCGFNVKNIFIMNETRHPVLTLQDFYF